MEINVEQVLTTAASGAKASSNVTYTTSFFLMVGDALNWVNDYAAALGFLIALATFALTWWFKEREYRARRIKDQIELEMNAAIKQRQAGKDISAEELQAIRNARHYGPARRDPRDV